MDLKYSGLIFVLIVILDAVSGSRISTTTVGSHNEDAAAVTTAPEKSHAENAAEAIKTIKPISSDVTSKSDKTTTTTSTTTTITTTTTPSTTTSSTTTSAPAPERGLWIIRNDKLNKTCVIAQMAMQLNITYPGKDKMLTNAILNVPKNANASGDCSDPHQSLLISWTPGHSLRINFNSNKTTNNFFVSSLELSVNATVLKDSGGTGKLTGAWDPWDDSSFSFCSEMTSNFGQNGRGDNPKVLPALYIPRPLFIINLYEKYSTTGLQSKCESLPMHHSNTVNNTIWHFRNGSSEFVTPLQMSYKCNREQDLNMRSSEGNQTAVLSMRDTQLEAYMNKTKSEFGAAQDCDSFDTPDIVPIAVGCALTILVLVVLAAYLIGRRRSQNRGYLSM